MASAMGQVLPLAIGVLASPLPIIAVILILLAPKARANGLAFLVGWLVGLLLVGLIGILVVDQTSVHDNDDSRIMQWVKIGVGVVLVVIAVRKWIGRPKPGEPVSPPGWMSALDTFTPLKSAGLGLTLAAIKPKNLLLTLAAAGLISDAGIDRGPELAVLSVFVIVASLGVLGPVVIYIALGSRAPAVLQAWSEWLTRNSSVVVTGVLLVIGFVLVLLGIRG